MRQKRKRDSHASGSIVAVQPLPGHPPDAMELSGLILSLPLTTTTSGLSVPPYIPLSDLRVGCEQKAFQGSRANPDSR